MGVRMIGPYRALQGHSGHKTVSFGADDTRQKKTGPAKKPEPLSRREAIVAMLLTPLAAIAAGRAIDSDPVRELAGLPTQAEELGLPEMERRLSELLGIPNAMTGLDQRVRGLEGAAVGDIATLQSQMADLSSRVQGLEASDQQNVKHGFLEERLTGFRQFLLEDLDLDGRFSSFKHLIFEELDLDGKLLAFKNQLLETLNLDGRLENFRTYLLEDLDIDGRFQGMRSEFNQLTSGLRTDLEAIGNRFNQFIEQRFPFVERLTTNIRDGYNNMVNAINEKLGLRLPLIQDPRP